MMIGTYVVGFVYTVTVVTRCGCFWCLLMCCDEMCCVQSLVSDAVQRAGDEVYKLGSKRCRCSDHGCKLESYSDLLAVCPGTAWLCLSHTWFPATHVHPGFQQKSWVSM